MTSAPISRRSRYPAPRLRARVLPEHARVESRGEIHRPVIRLELLLAIPVRGIAVDVDSEILGEAGDRLDESDPLVLHEKMERVASLPAAEAVIDLLLGIHREAGRLLAVKRAERLVVPPRLLQIEV